MPTKKSYEIKIINKRNPNLQMPTKKSYEIKIINKVLLGRNELIGSPFLRPHVPLVWRHGVENRKEGDGVPLTFGIASPNKRLARQAISLFVERVPGNCVVVLGL